MIIAIVLIALLAGFSFLANKKGWISTSQFMLNDSTSVVVSGADSVSDSLLDDSLFSGAPIQPADSLLAVESMVDTSKALQIKIEVTGDSVWTTLLMGSNRGKIPSSKIRSGNFQLTTVSMYIWEIILPLMFTSTENPLVYMARELSPLKSAKTEDLFPGHYQDGIQSLEIVSDHVGRFPCSPFRILS